MEIENIIQKNVSYLHARDPSILAWNRHGLDEVRVNLAKELLKDNSCKSDPSVNEYVVTDSDSESFNESQDVSCNLNSLLLMIHVGRSRPCSGVSEN
ncbi:hypothetical protein NQ317_003320 [Molorchus minor]|uniref:Uncharacterized protein n=1 Tax=Molorchus minor TaxID=1323400 RepID=A0ABQ9J0J6_9CUCU|nr:hypothetical protein NQ317_003320 [Molorchus minor]